MYVAGIDAHTSYLVVAVVGKDGALREKRRVHVHRPDRLDELLSQYRPLEVVVETSSAWPWLRIHAMLRTGEVWRNEKDDEMETGELLSPHAASTASNL